MDPKIIVLQGVQASGKSTWARNFVKSNKDFVIVNRDSIRESRGEYWIPSQEDYISDIEEFEVRSAISHKLSPIIDATNLNPKTIEKWKNIASELNCEIQFKEFKIDVATVIERDSKRERPVGKKVILDFFSRYYPEELKEYYKDKRLINIEIKPRCIICDIDGTIALNCGRSPYNYESVIQDKVNLPLWELLTELQKHYFIFFVSGREKTEQCYTDTMQWLMKFFPNNQFKLLMRKEKDYRADEIVKRELYLDYIKPNYFPIAVFDDRSKVVDMWRKEGLLCNQVYYGDF